MPRTVRGLPQTERHFCRCYACGWSCWFGASDWTCWSKPVRAICGGSCCFGARSTPVRAIWTAESFPSTLSLSWLWRGALRSCLLMVGGSEKERKGGRNAALVSSCDVCLSPGSRPPGCCQSCWFGASDWTCWSKPVRAICGGSCCFGARSTPVRAIWTAESFPSTLSLSWLWRGALRSCLLMASSTGSGNESDSLAYTRRPLAFIPGTSHFASLLLTCASAEE